MNRFYDPLQGRFTQVDPIGMSSVSLDSPQTLNLYAYCGNDPINHIDPSGLGFFSFFKKLFGVVGKIFKVIAVVVAVVLIFAATINIGNPAVSNWLIAGLFFAAGALLGSALGPSWLKTALRVTSGVVGGFQTSVGRTPSTFPGGSGSRGFNFQGTLVKPPSYTRAERYEIIFRAVWLAGEALRNNKACRDVVGGANSQIAFVSSARRSA